MNHRKVNLFTEEELIELDQIDSLVTDSCQAAWFIKIYDGIGFITFFFFKVREEFDSAVVFNLFYSRRGFIKCFGGSYVSNPLPFVVFKNDSNLNRIAHDYGISLL